MMTVKQVSEKQELIFFVEGEPRPKQSFRISGKGGFQPARIKAWQNDVAIEAEKAMRNIDRFSEPFTGEIHVHMIFFLGDNRRVDLDNLSKAVLDGLNHRVFLDDMQVTELFLKKSVVQKGNSQRPGVNIIITII